MLILPSLGPRKYVFNGYAFRSLFEIWVDRAEPVGQLYSSPTAAFGTSAFIFHSTFVPRIDSSPFASARLSAGVLNDPMHGVASALSDGGNNVQYNHGVMFYFAFWSFLSFLFMFGSVRTHMVNVVCDISSMLSFAFDIFDSQ